MGTGSETAGLVSRRRVLSYAGAGAAVVSAAGCDAFSTEPSQEGSGDAGGQGGKKNPKQAPELARQVKEGSLPSLGKRLPAKPMVLKPLDTTGRYGGDLNLIANFQERGLDLNAMIGNENLLCWKPGTTELTADQVIPNVAESYKVADGGATYTFKLREGMKWSDGKPFTADDIVFWFEDVASNSTLSPAGLADWLDTGGKHPLKVEKTDDQTVVFTFSEPNGLFVTNLATQRGTAIVSHPAHYMKQFHAGYVDAGELKQLAKKDEAQDWVQLFQNKHDLNVNPDLPTLNAWVFDKTPSNNQRPVARRNPYYWKTDSHGSQLPYLNRVVYTTINDDQAGLLKVSNGEIDLMYRGLNTLSNKPVLARGRDKGKYRFFTSIPQQMNRTVIMVNLTHKNPTLRKVFADKDFRIGLSYALNRKEINKTVFAKQGQPWQAAPRPQSPYANKTLAKQYTEFDTAKANQHLDKVLPDKDSSGRRLRPDGKPLSFQVEVATSQPDSVDVLQLVKKYWNDVGVNMSVKSEDQNLFFERMDANAHDACVWVGGGGLGSTMDPFYYVPYNFNTRYAMPWYFWVTNPKDKRAEEPPPATRRQIETYNELLKTADTDKQEQLMGEVIDVAADQFYVMGTVMLDELYGIVSNDLKNTPDKIIGGWLHADVGPSNPQQYFKTSPGPQ